MSQPGAGGRPTGREGTAAVPKRADARRNHQRLLQVAAELFAEHGEGASLDEIAKRAGVGSGTLYRHFPTRRALLEAAYVDRVEALAARADEIAGRLPPGEALAEWMRELALGTIRIRGLRALLGAAVTEGGTAATVCGTTLLGAAERLVEAARREGTLRRDVEPLDVLRLAHGLATASDLAEREEELVGRYVGLLSEGLRPRG
ncbi:TetR/AcrR family transcriptional regulator [Streptomyces sp. enrichment culture]|uniref:TetR/AcrR family transcriptional regulator n=1 Tax=Streptomyces sp. enrichment culture TaxID=1795815 RepID=UPI003F579871